MDFLVYEGDVVTVVTSVWRHSNQEFLQSVVVPKHSSAFRIKFSLLAEAGEEIFLRFAHRNTMEDWFYTFNSADVRARRLFTKRPDTSGENNYPIVGGLFIRYDNQSFLQFFPKFPLGAGIVDTTGFELHLHRNPSRDDDLGLGSGLQDNLRVEHEFLVKVSDFNATEMWRNYLLHKNALIVFAVEDSSGKITLDAKRAHYWNEEWKRHTEYSLVDEDPCVYLSSITVGGGKRYARVLNICESPQDFEMHGVKVKDEYLLNEKPLRENRNQVMVEGELEFKMSCNSGKSVLEFQAAEGEGAIAPFGFKAYEIDYKCKLFHHQALDNTQTVN